MIEVSPEAFREFAGVDVVICCTDEEQFMALARMEYRLGDKHAITNMENLLRIMRREGDYPYALRYRVSSTGKPSMEAWCSTKWYRENGTIPISFMDLFHEERETVLLPDLSGLLGGIR